ncbi:MAG: hypothetical protein Q7R34_07985 [Dehalococcoidia bacterium]|nr:hypothetical protein [Dehalococcoidia bacterium]
MIVLGIFILLVVSITIHTLSKKFIPIVVPNGRLKVWAVGVLGALTASILEGLIGPWEPKLAGIYIGAAIVGSLISIFGWGIAPFVSILIGLNIRKRVKGQVKQKGD